MALGLGLRTPSFPCREYNPPRHDPTAKSTTADSEQEPRWKPGDGDAIGKVRRQWSDCFSGECAGYRFRERRGDEVDGGWPWLVEKGVKPCPTAMELYPTA